MRHTLVEHKIVNSIEMHERIRPLVAIESSYEVNQIQSVHVDWVISNDKIGNQLTLTIKMKIYCSRQ